MYLPTVGTPYLCMHVTLEGPYRDDGGWIISEAGLVPGCRSSPQLRWPSTYNHILLPTLPSAFLLISPRAAGIGESTWLPIFFPHRGTPPVWRLEAAGGWQGWTRVELMRVLCADVPIPSAPTPHNLGRGGFGRAPDRKMGCIVTSNLPLYLVASRLANLRDNVDGRRGGELTN